MNNNTDIGALESGVGKREWHIAKDRERVLAANFGAK